MGRANEPAGLADARLDRARAGRGQARLRPRRRQAAGRAERLNACGGPVRPAASPAQPDEAGSPGSAVA
ncbi:hypothetical protein E1286_31330 [Nonomuraea terrae]|uniref:Uncharacterized protein n=1 Tax=Nonomuraea terrae TaxID=2530383 RepID=A0A4R4YE17_9ACTN|nr:hypothetical protein E1286_31330 [Nonomuraea terrae]